MWYIDLGQKDAGFQRCGRCGMRYSPGVDDVEHAAHCRTVAAGPACVPFPRVKDAWALGTPLFVKNAPRHGKKAAGSEVEVHVVAIPAGQCRSVVQRVKAQVDADLGVCELKPGQRVFLSVTAAPRNVVSVVVLELILMMMVFVMMLMIVLANMILVDFVMVLVKKLNVGMDHLYVKN